jgi:hypothetical protein
MHIRTRLIFVGLLLALSLRVTPAAADPTIGFGAGGGGGTLSFGGGPTGLVGTNIPIAYLIGTDTPASDGGFFMVGDGMAPGWLNFTTGAYQGFGGGVYQFGPGGTFQIVGNVPAVGIDDAPVLMSGALDFATIGNSGMVNMTLGYSGANPTVDSRVLDLFGLGPDAIFAITSILMASGSIGTGDPFLVPVFHSDWQATLSQTAEVTATPEPASVALLGSGLMMVGAALRRRMKRS